jgi:alpha-L-fucosidase 2
MASRWEKVWRAACWAALGNATQAKYELQLTMQRDFKVHFGKVTC